MKADVMLEENGGVSFDMGTSVDRVLTLEITPDGQMVVASLIDGITESAQGNAADVIPHFLRLVTRLERIIENEEARSRAFPCPHCNTPLGDEPTHDSAGCVHHEACCYLCHPNRVNAKPH